MKYNVTWIIYSINSKLNITFGLSLCLFNINCFFFLWICHEVCNIWRYYLRYFSTCWNQIWFVNIFNYYIFLVELVHVQGYITICSLSSRIQKFMVDTLLELQLCIPCYKLFQLFLNFEHYVDTILFYIFTISCIVFYYR